MFNVDGCSSSISNFPPPITLEQLCRPVNELEGTSVDVFIHCVNLGGDAYNYPSKIGEMYGQWIRDWSGVPPHMKNQGENLKSLVDRGHDPIEVLQNRTRELGMKFWLGMRMNEQHEDDVDRFGSKITPFKKNNPHLLIGADFPPDEMGYAGKYGYSYTWNYAQAQTREHKLAVLREILDRYNIDGLELDFCKGPVYFKQGEEEAGKPLMTQFVRDVRDLVDKYSQAKSRQIQLAVKVRPSFKRSEMLGLDVRRWIGEDLIDIVIPMDGGYLDMQPDLREFVEAARGTQMKQIAGGLENYVSGYARNTSRAMAFAAASSFLEQGANAIYFFNFDCHRHKGRANPYTDEEIEILTNIGQPEKYARADKHYFVTRGNRHQLPATLTPGMPQHFSLTVGDHLSSAQRDGVLKSSYLEVTMSGHNAGQDNANRLIVRMNGKLPGDGYLRSERHTIRWIDPPARQGENELSITIQNYPNDEKSGVVDKIELKILYP